MKNDLTTTYKYHTLKTDVRAPGLSALLAAGARITEDDAPSS
jgi:hypothetical protein